MVFSNFSWPIVCIGVVQVLIVPVLAYCAGQLVQRVLAQLWQWLKKKTAPKPLLHAAHHLVWFVCLAISSFFAESWVTTHPVQFRVYIAVLSALPAILAFTLFCWWAIDGLVSLLAYYLLENQMMHEMGLVRVATIIFKGLGALAALLLTPRCFFYYELNAVLTYFSLGTLAVGVAATMAAQGIIKHFWAALLIGVERLFAVGDWIEVKDTAGVVEEITFRVTRIRTSDQSVAYLPNETLLTEPVNNHGLLQYRKFKVRLAVAAHQKKEARELIGDLMLRFVEHPRVSLNSAFQCHEREEGEYTLYCHLYLKPKTEGEERGGDSLNRLLTEWAGLARSWQITAHYS